MKSRNLILNLFFLVIAAGQLFGSWHDIKSIEYAFKPLILIWITVYFLLNTGPAPYRKLVLLAFFFSWVGDLLLMFAWKHDLFFFAGVGGFFASQLAYIQAFRKFAVSTQKGFVARKPIWLLPFGFYLVFIFFLILPGLEGIMIPVVFLYAVSLIGMSVAALNRYQRVDSNSFGLLFSGSLLFLVSDSLLAYNRFVTEIPNGGFWVMLTYIGAQYLIMQGLCRDA